MYINCGELHSVVYEENQRQRQTIDNDKSDVVFYPLIFALYILNICSIYRVKIYRIYLYIYYISGDEQHDLLFFFV